MIRKETDSRTRSPARCSSSTAPSAETNGEAVLVETIVRPDGFVAAAHVHPHQTERFEVVEGLVGLRVGEKELLRRRVTSPSSRRHAAPLLERRRERRPLPLRGAACALSSSR